MCYVANLFSFKNFINIIEIIEALTDNSLLNTLLCDENSKSDITSWRYHLDCRM